MGLLAAITIIIVLGGIGRLIALTIRAIVVLARVLLTLVLAYVALTFVLFYVAREAVTSS